MNELKMQLKHPQGKKAIRIDKEKYDVLSQETIHCLTVHADPTFSELSEFVERRLAIRDIKFEGSITWYLEWVKLDLEARQIITRVSKASPQRYRLIKRNEIY